MDPLGSCHLSKSPAEDQSRVNDHFHITDGHGAFGNVSPQNHLYLTSWRPPGSNINETIDHDMTQ